VALKSVAEMRLQVRCTTIFMLLSNLTQSDSEILVSIVTGGPASLWHQPYKCSASPVFVRFSVLTRS